VLYGSIAARFAGIPNVINAMTGLGYVFSSEDFLARLIRFLISPLLGCIFSTNKTITIFQNKDDLKTLEDRNLVRQEQTVIIRGSGVDPDIYVPGKDNEDIPKVILVARMLWDKGIGEFVEAAKLLVAKGTSARLILIGDTDNDTPAAISVTQLKAWQDEKSIEWWGRRDDIPEILQQSTIACLPSYREGLPKFLLEAASAGLPIVTTDVPGCREVVIDGENGYLIPTKNPEALAEAIEKLLNDKVLRREMGAKGRSLVEREFGIGKVVDETLSLYQGILN
jgi:glycosyltransferase involved in cell wall biosynthesis